MEVETFEQYDSHQNVNSSVDNLLNEESPSEQVGEVPKSIAEASEDCVINDVSHTSPEWIWQPHSAS